MVKNQSFKQDKVDVTTKFSTSLKSSINRDKDLKKINTRLQQAKGQYSVQNVENININNLEDSFNSSYLRILNCLEKQSLFSFVLYCEYL